MPAVAADPHPRSLARCAGAGRGGARSRPAGEPPRSTRIPDDAPGARRAHLRGPRRFSPVPSGSGDAGRASESGREPFPEEPEPITPDSASRQRPTMQNPSQRFLFPVEALIPSALLRVVFFSVAPDGLPVPLPGSRARERRVRPAEGDEDTASSPGNPEPKGASPPPSAKGPTSRPGTRSLGGAK